MSKLTRITRSQGELMPWLALLSLLSLGYAIYADLNFEWLWSTFALCALFNIVLVESYLHRYCTHRSYKLNPVIEKILAVLAAVVPGTGSPLGWMSVHTAHHAYSDTPKDPHSCWHSSFINLAIWRYPYTGTLKSSRPMMNSKFHQFLHRYYLLFLIAWATLNFALFGIEGLIFNVLLTWGLGVGLSVFQNYFLHYPLPFTYRNHETPDHSQNSWLLHFLSFGACGWHNNHHARPKAWHTGEKWWEFDTASWFIRIVRRKQ